MYVCIHLFLYIHFIYICVYESISILLIGVAVWDDPTSAHRAFSGKGLYPVVEEKERDLLSEGSYTPVWRLGEHYKTAKQLLLRLATTLDVKEQGSASRSKYYRKYGNPNLPSYQVNKGQRKDLRYQDCLLSNNFYRFH